ncbi:MAG TPA: DUF4166 domain-containing protein, partial [Terricaulis sp.]|nr:DUF4166 domain-containing protein [Terricaulis sp.]
ASVQAAHRAGPVARFSGTAAVEGAAAPLGKALAALFGFPAAQEQLPVRVTKRHDGKVETWTRQLGRRIMRSRLRKLGPGRVRESFGPFHFDMAVSASAEGLVMEVVGWKLGLLPLPAFLAPRSRAAETDAGGGRYRFDVPIAAPFLGRLTHYSGDLGIEELEVGAASAAREAP